MNNWISVDDELPKGDERILIYCDGESGDPDNDGVRESWYSFVGPGRNFIMPDFGQTIIYGWRGVTHWMPLPDPPEGCQHEWVKIDNPSVHNHTGTFCHLCGAIPE